MRKGIKKIITIVSLFSLIVGKTTKAIDINYNEEINIKSKNQIGNITDSLRYEGWHYEGGYWQFTRSDTGKIDTILDSNVPIAFPGNATNMQGGEFVKVYPLPQNISNQIKKYGANKLGIKFNIGNEKSVKNLRYELTDNTIIIKFMPVLNYKRYDMWHTLNNNVTSKMINKNVYTPQVLAGYGYNYLSVRDGSSSIILTEENVSSATTDGNYLFCGGTYCNWYTFSRGGNNGVSFQFPISIDFYDNNDYPSVNALANTYRVQKIGEIETTPLHGQLPIPVKIFTDIKTSMVVKWIGEKVKIEFIDRGSGQRIKVEAEEGKIVDLVEFAGNSTKENSEEFSFYLPKTVKNDTRINVVATASNGDLEDKNTKFGENFYHVRGDARRFISVNNIR